MTEPADSRREIDYYKRRLDELAGETVRLDYEISGLRKEIKQKRQAFALLSKLQQNVGAETELSSIFEAVLRDMNATLGMDRSVALSATDRANVFRPTQWTGFTEEGRAAELEESFSTSQIEFPAELLQSGGFLLANKATTPTTLVETLHRLFELPFFVCVPVIVEGSPVGLLLSGRIKEAGSVFPPLDRGDVETLQSISALISASVENMRIGVLQEMDRLKTDFFANISHEFRTPITLTLGSLDGMLSGRYGEISNEMKNVVLRAQRSQDRLLVLVNQILNLAKLEAGRVRLRAAPVRDINSIVEERLESFRPAALDRELELRTSLDPRLRRRDDLFVDREKFDELLGNLVANALKFTREGWVEVATTLRDDELVLSVRDTGVGISADELPHIFDRFRQADTSASREYAGTGIGLAWVKEIAALHGGRVAARSDFGKGSSFEVSFPLGSSHLDPASVVEFEEEDLRTVGRGSRVYIVSEGASDRADVESHNGRIAEELDASKPALLYAEDNPDLRAHVCELLEEHYNVFLAVDGKDALEKMRRYRPELALVDQMMPRMSGTELLREVRQDDELGATPMIFLTARVSRETHMEALEAGAEDYVTKPFDAEELLARIRNLLRIRAQERELQELNRDLEARLEEQMAAVVRRGETRRALPHAVVENVVSRSAAMQEVLRSAWTVADTPSTILIQGETGTGKDVIARALHRHSRRADGPFVAVHCAALPVSLLESELFGHEKGAFTGATASRVGRFELAHGGTLFLDEVGEIALEVQAKLLRVLQERCFERLGGNRVIEIDVRVIAATNRDLDAAVREGGFREDLFYRLNVVPLRLPPLRQRPEDVPLLVAHFLERYRRHAGRPSIGITDAAMRRLSSYPWPGNVRELQNVMERLAVTVDADAIEPSHLPVELGAVAPRSDGVPTLEEHERRYIESILQRTNGVIRGKLGAAALLGLPESTLRHRIKKLGIARD